MGGEAVRVQQGRRDWFGGRIEQKEGAKGKVFEVGWSRRGVLLVPEGVKLKCS